MTMEATAVAAMPRRVLACIVQSGHEDLPPQLTPISRVLTNAGKVVFAALVLWLIVNDLFWLARELLFLL